MSGWARLHSTVVAAHAFNTLRLFGSKEGIQGLLLELETSPPLLACLRGNQLGLSTHLPRMLVQTRRLIVT
jgi:hypothetical protein